VVNVADDCVPIYADFGHGEFAPPVVVSQGQHVCRLPGALSLLLPQQPGTHMIVPIAKDIRLYGDQVVNHSLDGKKATVHLWLYVFDDYPISSLVRLLH
jgi:hypothetical protein